MNDAPDDLAQRLAAHGALLAAIARCGSFSAAAEHLGLVQSAVSQRVKALEARLGGPLFVRTTRKLTRTPLGDIVCAAAERSMDDWSAVVERVREARNPATIDISVSSALALKWAIPALPRIAPDAGDVRFRIDEGLAPLHNGDAQVALRFGPGHYPGLHADLVCRCALVPVASPRFRIAERLDALLANGSPHLLHDRRAAQDGTQVSWAAYAAGRGLIAGEQGKGAVHDRSDLALQAAIGGMGIALGRTLLVEGDIAAGLLAVVGPPVPARSRYWIVTTASFAATARYEALRDAVRQEADRTRAAALHG